MQVWDQVKVIGDSTYKNQAGVVQATNAKTEVASVKLDMEAEPMDFGYAELQFLGR